MDGWKLSAVLLAVGAALCTSSPHRPRRDTQTLKIGFSVSRYNNSFAPDPFCNQGLDRPGNITLEVSYRTGAVNEGGSRCSRDEWKHLATISTGEDRELLV